MRLRRFHYHPSTTNPSSMGAPTNRGESSSRRIDTSSSGTLPRADQDHHHFRPAEDGRGYRSKVEKHVAAGPAGGRLVSISVKGVPNGLPRRCNAGHVITLSRCTEPWRPKCPTKFR